MKKQMGKGRTGLGKNKELLCSAPYRKGSVEGNFDCFFLEINNYDREIKAVLNGWCGHPGTEGFGMCSAETSGRVAVALLG